MAIQTNQLTHADIGKEIEYYNGKYATKRRRGKLKSWSAAKLYIEQERILVWTNGASKAEVLEIDPQRAFWFGELAAELVEINIDDCIA